MLDGTSLACESESPVTVLLKFMISTSSACFGSSAKALETHKAIVASMWILEAPFWKCFFGALFVMGARMAARAGDSLMGR
jgi:hypothetical protein